MTVSIEDVAAHRVLSDKVHRAADREMRALATRITMGDAVKAEREAKKALAAILSRHQGVTAELAVTWVETAWAAAEVPGAPKIVIPGRANAEIADAGAGWAASALYGRSPDVPTFMNRLSTSVDSALRHTSRDVIVATSEANPHRVKTRYALVPAGQCCSMCSMLAGRGAVYKSPDFSKVHAQCRCVLTPIYEYVSVRDGRSKRYSDKVTAEHAIVGYDPAPYEEMYAKAREAGDGSFKGTLAAMRRLYGLK